jgi:hypothetical protein
MPTIRSVSDIKANLLRPALTSHFEVEIPIPGGDFRKVLEDNGIFWGSSEDIKLRLMCSEATLPGSNLATLEVTNDFHGVTERHAYRRIYDDRIDLTFYVDAKNYLPIRIFETWMKYISDESISAQSDKDVGSINPNYFYRMRYPDGNNGYAAPQGLKVIKFERDYQQRLEYEFIKAFPISITSMPVSYDSSSLLKCTVSMTYIRYVLIQGKTQSDDNMIAQQQVEKQQKINPDQPASQRRQDLDIWALTNRQMINNVGRPDQRELLADVDAYYKNNVSAQINLQDLTTKGGYTAGTAGKDRGKPLPGTRLKFI